MQVWCDIYTYPPEVPEIYKWRIVIDTRRNLFVVLNSKDEVTDYQPECVTIKDGIYQVSDIPTREGIGTNILFKIVRIPPTIKILKGTEAWFKHVVYFKGRYVGMKDYYPTIYWEPTEKIVIFPAILEARRLLTYMLKVETEVKKVE